MKHTQTFKIFESSLNELDSKGIEQKFTSMSASDTFQFGLLSTLLNDAADELDAATLLRIIKEVVKDSFGNEILQASPVTKEKILALLNKRIGFSKKVTAAMSKAMIELENVKESAEVNEDTSKTASPELAAEFITQVLKLGSRNNLFDAFIKKKGMNADEMSALVKMVATELETKWL